MRKVIAWFILITAVVGCIAGGIVLTGFEDFLIYSGLVTVFSLIAVAVGWAVHEILS